MIFSNIEFINAEVLNHIILCQIQPFYVLSL